MKAPHTSPVHQLKPDQLAMLVSIVIEESGDRLNLAQFNDAMLLLFENIAGFENLSSRQANPYLKSLWKMYHPDRV